MRNESTSKEESARSQARRLLNELESYKTQIWRSNRSSINASEARDLRGMLRIVGFFSTNPGIPALPVKTEVNRLSKLLGDGAL